MSKSKSIMEEYREVSALAKLTTDRRKRRPELGYIHRTELEVILQDRLPRGMKATVTAPSYPGEVVVNLRPDYDTYYGLPAWKQNAYDSIYATWYLSASSEGWIFDKNYFIRCLGAFEREIVALRKSMMTEFRAARELAEPESAKSRKGKPRRVVKQGNFEDFFIKQQDRVASSDNVIELLPTVPALLDSTRTWGIEIEVAGSRGIATPYRWVATEDGSLRSAYDSYDGNCECECDYCAEWNEHDCGRDECEIGNRDADCREFVSPILSGMYERGITEICDGARFEPQNATAGIHVHVGADNLTPKQIGGLVYAYGILEQMLETSYHREEREYCEGLDAESVREVLKRARSVRSKEEMGVLDRYTTVNVQALSKHGTVEFRAMGPVYEAEYLHKWALFCREMVNVAASNAPIKVWSKVKTFADVIQIFRDYGSEVNAIEALEKSKAEKVEAPVMAVA